MVHMLGSFEQKHLESPSTASPCSPLSSSSSTSQLDGSASSSSSRTFPPAWSLMRTSSLGAIGRLGRGTQTSTQAAHPGTVARLEAWQVPQAWQAPISAKAVEDHTQKAPATPEETSSRPASRGSSKGFGSFVTKSGLFDAENAGVLKAFSKAKRVGVDTHQAEKLLNEEHESQGLARATASAHAKALRATFNRNATQAGVDRRRVEEARRTITECEVFKLLEQAIAAEDPMALQYAILQARRANLPKKDIEAAEKVGVGIEARSRLKAALACKQIESIKWALESAEEICKETKLFQEAQQHLQRLEVLKDLEGAMSIKDRFTVRMCLQDALEAGVEGPEVDRAKEFCAQMEAWEAKRCSSRESDRGVRMRRTSSNAADSSPTSSWGLQMCACASENSALQTTRRGTRRTLTLPNVRASATVLPSAGSSPSPTPRRSVSRPRATMPAMSGW